MLKLNRKQGATPLTKPVLIKTKKLRMIFFLNIIHKIPIAISQKPSDIEHLNLTTRYIAHWMP